MTSRPSAGETSRANTARSSASRVSSTAFSPWRRVDANAGLAERVDLPRRLTERMAAWSPSADSIDVELVSVTSRGGTVHASEEGLRQVLDNLIENALHASPAGGQVTVTAAPNELRARDPPWARVRAARACVRPLLALACGAGIRARPRDRAPPRRGGRRRSRAGARRARRPGGRCSLRKAG